MFIIDLNYSLCALGLQLSLCATACSGDILRSVSTLSCLQYLELCTHGLRQPISKIAMLSGLQSLLLTSAGDVPQPRAEGSSCLQVADVAPLFNLTRLTLLSLRDFTHGSCLRDAPPPSRAQADSDTQAFAPLAGLLRLRKLTLSDEFIVDDAVFSALKHLPQLTSLAVGRIQLADSTAGVYLPALQELAVSQCRSPTHWLRTLLPLSPLPALHCLRRGSFPHPSINLSHNGTPENSKEEARSLNHLSRILGAAPHAEQLMLAVFLCAGGKGGTCLPGQAVSDFLAPFASHLIELILVDLPAIDVQWSRLVTSLPTLRCLRLAGCCVTDTALIAMLSRWPLLQTLSLQQCEGISSEGWLALAAVRKAPLTVTVWDDNMYGRSEEVAALQVRLFGRQTLFFARSDG